jgi:hypothetical protein
MTDLYRFFNHLLVEDERNNIPVKYSTVFQQYSTSWECQVTDFKGLFRLIPLFHYPEEGSPQMASKRSIDEHRAQMAKALRSRNCLVTGQSRPPLSTQTSA